MLRALFLLLLGAIGVHASDALPAPGGRISNRVSQPHVTAELIPETMAALCGNPFLVVLHLHMDPGWHTYWINPGDAGLATTIKWTLPPGFTAGPIQWPTPEIHKMGPLTTYGYADDVYLLTTITPPLIFTGNMPSHLEIKAHAEWLVCQEECIPGKADLALKQDFNVGFGGAMGSAYYSFFKEVKARLPVANTRWGVKAGYGKGRGTVDHLPEALWIEFTTKQGQSSQPLGKIYFFPEQGNVLSANESDNGLPESDEGPFMFNLVLPLQQNGEKPAQLSGVLVSDRPLIGDSKAVYISEFRTDADIPKTIAQDGTIVSAGGYSAYAYPQKFIAPTEGTTDGVSNLVTQPHVRAELISETDAVSIGKPFLVALHLHMDPGWHTYWINPGDAGLATTIKWTLPPGFTAGPIQWPTPEIHKMGPLTTYGYADDVYLLTTITPPDRLAGYLPPRLEFKARADWLVCQEECIPGRADLMLPLAFHANGVATTSADRKKVFDDAKARVPVANTRWGVKAAYGKGGGTVDNQREALWIEFTTPKGQSTQPLGKVYFFPEQGNVLSANESDNGLPEPNEELSDFELPLTLQQNGEKPAQLSGVLVSDRPLIGDSKAVYIPAFRTDGKDVPQVITRTGLSLGADGLEAYAHPHKFIAPTEKASDGHKPPLQEEAPPFLLAVLGAAFLGGLILNLMPCVLPVLSLKVFSLIRHAGTAAPWKQGVAFTIGVVLSFWVLAGLLIALRAAGNHLGWGFQMQSPGFVLALIFLFFLLGLNLLGVFEIGTSLVGLDAKAAGHAHSGLTSSFLNGALATLAATPCTAPFMGSSVGFAANQPPFVAMLVFTVLALGMAAPYLLLTIFPGALRFVPKPGAWMEAVRQVMGFLLLATVIFLIYVFGALVGQENVPYLLGLLLLTSVAAWIYGRWGWPFAHHSRWVGACLVFCLVFLVYVVAGTAVQMISSSTTGAPAQPSTAATNGWQPWTSAAVDEALAKNEPVFVDFTAAWCLSCKVNEGVALENDSVKRAFTEKHVALFRADWTHADPAISAVLEKYHRDGVPLYLLYSPQGKDAPQILPEVLTPGVVLEALGKAR